MRKQKVLGALIDLSIMLVLMGIAIYQIVTMSWENKGAKNEFV